MNYEQEEDKWLSMEEKLKMMYLGHTNAYYRQRRKINWEREYI